MKRLTKLIEKFLVEKRDVSKKETRIVTEEDMEQLRSVIDELLRLKFKTNNVNEVLIDYQLADFTHELFLLSEDWNKESHLDYGKFSSNEIKERLKKLNVALQIIVDTIGRRFQHLTSAEMREEGKI